MIDAVPHNQALPTARDRRPAVGRALALLAVLGCVLSARSADRPQPAYVGTDICVRCHIDFARRWAGLAHSTAMSAPGRPPEKTGCEACHGPGGEHVAADRRRIVRWSDLDTAGASAVCLQCHEETVKADLWRASIHSELLACDGCHEVHRPVDREALLKAAEGEECSECHDMPALVAAGHHHPLAEGALPCAMCHSFHGAENPRLLAMPQEESCLECHAEGDELRPEWHRNDEFKLEHGERAKADRETCLTCHDEQATCAGCHSVTIPHGQDYAIDHGPEAAEKLQACLNCHGEEYCLQCHDSLPKPAEAEAAP